MNIGRKIWIISGLIVLMASVLIGSRGVKAAASAGFIINKSIENRNITTASNGSAGKAATVTRPADEVRITITVTNLGPDKKSITVTDKYQAGSRSYGFSSASDGAWSGSGGSVSFSNGVATGISPQITVGGQLEMSYKVTMALNLPTNKTRLVAFPVSSDSSGILDVVYDVGYVLFTPNIDNVKENTVASSFVKKGAAAADDLYDLAFMIPGVTVSVGSTTVTAGETMALRSMASGNANTITCNGMSVYNRGGACLYNTKVTVTVNSGGQSIDAASASAMLMTVPASAVIGSIKIGTDSNINGDASNVLLPGEHVASGVGGSTANQNINYAIDPGSVTGLKDATDPSKYGNVYLDVNLSLVKKNPDFVINKDSYTRVKNLIQAGENGVSAFALSCDNACPAGANPQIFRLVPSAVNGKIVDLSTQSLTNSVATGPKNPKKGGYVWFIDGDLVLGDATFREITNVGLGTIFVNGNLTISNVSIKAISGAGLGIIAKNITWKTDVVAPEKSELNSVAIFANGNFVGSTTRSDHSLSLLGTIVARVNVDFAGVKVSNDADTVNLKVVYDSTMAQNAPPGMAKLSPSVNLSDNP